MVLIHIEIVRLEDIGTSSSIDGVLVDLFFGVLTHLHKHFEIGGVAASETAFFRGALGASFGDAGGVHVSWSGDFTVEEGFEGSLRPGGGGILVLVDVAPKPLSRIRGKLVDHEFLSLEERHCHVIGALILSFVSWVGT